MKNLSPVNNSQFLRHSKFWDRTGMFVAGLCIVHCLLFPFLLIALPASRELFHSPILEGVILLAGIIAGSISFTTSYKKHRLPYPMMIGLTGVALLAINLFVFTEDKTHVDLSGGPIAVAPLMILGGILLVAGHAWNLHACHCFCDKSCDHDHHES